MGITEKLHFILNALTQKDNPIFTYPKEKQEQYIQCLKEPKDDIERSYNQYLCQMKLFSSSIIRIGMNLASFPMIFYYLLKSSRQSASDNVKGTAVFFSDGKPENVIPKSLFDQYKRIITIRDKGELLDTTAKKFFFSIWKRYPFSFYFLLKVLIKTRYYCYAINQFSPNSIITCNEYSFTSSCMSKLCSIYKVQHINVMHGEKLFYIRDSFFRFDKCFVWDQYYIDLFLKLRAEKSQFIIEVPESLLFCNRDNIEKEFDYTYYLGAETGDTLRKIVKTMTILKQKGNRVAIRPHPRYTDLKELKNNDDSITIENANEITIERSLLRTQHAVSLYSSVLNQAEHNGIKVVIDDLSDSGKYNMLLDLNYIMMNKDHQLLSDIIEV